MPRQEKEYRTLHKEIRNKCRHAKKEWLDEKCAEIKTVSQIKQIYINKSTGQKTCSSTGCLKSKDGTLILEKEKYFKDGTNILENTSTTKENWQYAEISTNRKY